MFFDYVAIIIVGAIKKDCSAIETTAVIRLHAGDLEHSIMKERKK